MRKSKLINVLLDKEIRDYEMQDRKMYRAYR